MSESEKPPVAPTELRNPDKKVVEPTPLESPKQAKKSQAAAAAEAPEAQGGNKKVLCETSWWSSSRGHKHRVITWSPIKPKKEIKYEIIKNNYS